MRARSTTNPRCVPSIFLAGFSIFDIDQKAQSIHRNFVHLKFTAAISPFTTPSLSLLFPLMFSGSMISIRSIPIRSLPAGFYAKFSLVFAMQTNGPFILVFVVTTTQVNAMRPISLHIAIKKSTNRS